MVGTLLRGTREGAFARVPIERILIASRSRGWVLSEQNHLGPPIDFHLSKWKHLAGARWIRMLAGGTSYVR